MSKIPLKDILVENSTYNRYWLKKRLLKENLLQNKCYICNLLPEWNGIPLVLHLDHINGIFNDNRLENLRILCPNCHSQTETFGAKNKAKTIKPPCLECGEPVKNKTAQRHQQCRNYKIPNPKVRKIDWPSLEELEQMLEESNYVQVGRRLGVSDNAVRKHLKKRREEL